MSPEVRNTGRDFVQAAATKLRQEIASVGPKDAPTPPSEPKSTEGTVDLGKYTEDMKAHREAERVHADEKKAFDEAQEKRKEMGEKIAGTFKNQQKDVEQIARLKEEGRSPINPRTGEPSPELSSIAESTVRYMVGVQEGVVSMDHIADPEVRSFAQRAVKALAERSLKMADPKSVLESYQLIQELTREEMNLDELKQKYEAFRASTGRDSKAVVADVSAAMIGVFESTEEEELKSVLETTQEKRKIMDEIREKFSAEVPDTSGQDALEAFAACDVIASQLLAGGRGSESEKDFLKKSVHDVINEVKKGNVDLKAVYGGNDKLEGMAIRLLQNIQEKRLIDNVEMVATIYPAVNALVSGTASMQTLEKAFDKFARIWVLEEEEKTNDFASLLKEGAQMLKGNHDTNEELRQAKERFFGNALSDGEIDGLAERMFDPEAASPLTYMFDERKYGKVVDVYKNTEDLKLLRAIFEAEDSLEPYLEARLEAVQKDIMSGIEEKLRKSLGTDGELSPATLTQEVRKEAAKKLALDFKDDVALLFGKLFKTVDEEAPATYWGEAVQEGDMWSQTANLAATFKKSLERVRDMKFKEGSIVQELLWTRRGEEFSLPKRQENASGSSEEMVRYSSTYKRDIKLGSWQEYMLLVSKGVAATEGIKRYIHDARATQYNPAPEGGHLGQLKGFADSHMSSLDFDSFYEMPDSEYMMEAAQLWDAMSRIQFAETNWVIPSSGDIDHESGTPEADKRTLAYLNRHKGGLEDWRLRQAASLGAGHHFSGMSLSGIMGAWADAPQNLDGSNQFRSYGVRDAEAYAEINPLRHILHRFRSSGMNTSILYTPIGTIDRNGNVQWGVDEEFSYENLQAAEKRFADATTKGKAKEDVSIIRVIDVMNPGKIGDAVTRGGWRDIASVDHWYIDRSDPEQGNRRLNALEGLKANEHIGTEFVKDYFNHLVNGDIDATKSFFESKKSPEDERSGRPYTIRKDLDVSAHVREEIVGYVFDRYFADEFTFHNPKATAEQVANAKKNIFDALENGGVDDKLEWKENKGKKNGAPTQDSVDQIKDRYKNWFMKATARSMLQQDPSLLLTIERNNEVYDRSRAWDQVKQLAQQPYKKDLDAIDSEYEAAMQKVKSDHPEDKEMWQREQKRLDQERSAQKDALYESSVFGGTQYRQSVEDLAAVSASVLRACRDDKWKQLNDGGVWVDQIELGTNDFVTEEKVRAHMMAMKEKGMLGDEAEADARIDRAVRVYNANRQFSYGEESVDGKQIVNESGGASTFVDAMAFKLKLPWPIGFHRAIGVGSVDFRALALREAGSRMPARVLGDASHLAHGVAKPLGDLVAKLVEVAGKENRAEGNAELAELMKGAKDTFNGIHGKKEAYELTAGIMVPMAVRMFRADDSAFHMVRAGYGRFLESINEGNKGNRWAGKYRSLSEAVSGASNWHGSRVDKPQDTREMLEFFADPGVGVIPQSRYDSAVAAKYEYDEETGKRRRSADFDSLNLSDVSKSVRAKRADVFKRYARFVPLWIAVGGIFATLATLIRGIKAEVSK